MGGEALGERDGEDRHGARSSEVLLEEHREMQARAYRRIRPYIAGAMYRLRRAYPEFKTVVFSAERADFALVFADATRPHEAAKSFCGLQAACRDLAKLSEIEWITAGDTIWQVYQSGASIESVIEQYRYVEHVDWQFWMRRSLRDARYYMRHDIYSRTVHGSHRPGYGKRLMGDDGSTVDEWIDPIEPMIVRALREAGGAVDLKRLCDRMNAIAGFRDGYYIWDVLKACARLQDIGALRRTNPRASEGDARFALAS